MNLLVRHKFNIFNSTPFFPTKYMTTAVSDITAWASKDGEFRRQQSVFRDFIKKDGPYQPEGNRYHLFVSLACPWATRTLIVRKLKGLEKLISVSVVHWSMQKLGWQFTEDYPDHLFQSKHIREIYFKVNPDYEGRFTVPVLWDKKLNTMVNNESSEIIRMLNSEFNELIEEPYRSIDLYPTTLQPAIDSINEWIYSDINNGVYKSGFATTQEAYELNVRVLFKALEKVEALLGNNAYLVGNQLTEADVRLFVTLIRFDPVYVQHFKCNIGMIRFDFPNLNRWMKNLYWTNDAFKSTCDFDHIKFHYTKSHPQINPYGITPLGPLPNIQAL